MAKSIRSTRSPSRKKTATLGLKAQKARPSARKKAIQGAQASMMGRKKSAKAQGAPVSGRSVLTGAPLTSRGGARTSAKKATGRATLRAKPAASGRVSKRASQVKRALKKGFSELIKATV